MKRIAVQNMLIFAAVIFGFLYFCGMYSSVFYLEVVSALGALAFGVAAIILFYIRSPQRRQGEQVNY